MPTFTFTEDYIRKAVINDARFYEHFEEPYCIIWRGKTVCAYETNKLVHKLMGIEKRLGEENGL